MPPRCSAGLTRRAEYLGSDMYINPDKCVACVWYTCIAVFGLELTVGVSWAVTLDIGADFAGSVSAVMNSCGNIGGAISPLVLARLVKAYSWDMPFFFASGFCLIAAALFCRIDARRRIFAE